MWEWVIEVIEMGKGFKAIVNDDGSVKIEWNGFVGDTCYLEAQKMYNFLKSMGVEVEIKQILPKVDGVKVNKVAVATKQMERGL